MKAAHPHLKIDFINTFIVFVMEDLVVGDSFFSLLAGDSFCAKDEHILLDQLIRLHYMEMYVNV